MRRESSVAGRLLGADAELLDQFQIALAIRLVHVLEERRPAADLHEQAAARGVVLGVLLQMLGERADLSCEQGDLHFGRARVAVLAAELHDDLLLGLGLCQALFRLRHLPPCDSRRGRSQPAVAGAASRAGGSIGLSRERPGWGGRTLAAVGSDAQEWRVAGVSADAAARRPRDR